MTAQHMSIWRDCIRAWYPEYETSTYFVPPVVITRILFDVVTVAGQSVLVPQCNHAQTCAITSSSSQVKALIQDSDTRDDLALQQVLLFLRELVSEQREPMFVISQLQFSSYLGEPCYAAAAKRFSRPRDLSKHHRRGAFDILVIHRHYGIITGEIKSVLSNQQQLQLPQANVDRVVSDKVRNAIKQLNKSEIVLREITKDLDPNLAIRKILILPYVTTDILKRVVSSDEKLKEDLITCLMAVDFEQSLQRCLLAENISGMISDHQQQTRWPTFDTFKNQNMSSRLYLDLLARFCGPATTVSVYCPTSPRIEIRTEGEGVALTGERMTSLVLTPEQISLLTKASTKVLLTGPPGVGKSVMLVLKALTWLSQGHEVHLVSAGISSLAATHMINHMIQVSMHNDPTIPSVLGSVQLHDYNFYHEVSDVNKAINTLTDTIRSQGPYVICDEFWTDDTHIDQYQWFITELCMQRPNICLWAASPVHHQRPAELQEEQMTTPLRCPPAVLSEVNKAISIYSKTIYPYTMTSLAAPLDGPEVIHLSHKGPEHVGQWPLECTKCGQSIAVILQRLKVGLMDSVVSSSSTYTTTSTTVNIHTNRTNVNKASACPPLQYRDVFVLTRSFDLHDDIINEEEPVTYSTNGVVHGLRSAGIPVRVIRSRYESTDVCDTAVTQTDKVTVTYFGDVSGLERKVVVWLPGRIQDVDDHKTDEQIEFDARLLALSRCTSQLIVVDVPVSDVDQLVQTTQRRWRCCVS